MLSSYQLGERLQYDAFEDIWDACEWHRHEKLTSGPRSVVELGLREACHFSVFFSLSGKNKCFLIHEVVGSCHILRSTLLKLQRKKKKQVLQKQRSPADRIKIKALGAWSSPSLTTSTVPKRNSSSPSKCWNLCCQAIKKNHAIN